MQVVEWKHTILHDARCAIGDYIAGGLNPPIVIFDVIERLNQYHDFIHLMVIQKIELELRETDNPPPFSYCWVDMGSGGRRERTLWSDQDNGIIYQCNEKRSS